MQFTITLLLSAIPVFALCAYVYHEDRYEKESILLLLLLFILGMICAVCSAFVKNIGHFLLDKLFSNQMTISFDEIIFSTPFAEYLYKSLLAFIVYAATDIALAMIVLFAFTYKNKNFNSLFDGIVYVTYIIMGMTFVEILLFGYNAGWSLIALKSLVIIPLRMIIGVLMGFQYSKFKIHHLIYNKEKSLNAAEKLHTISGFKKYKLLILMFFIPLLLIGAYEFSELVNTNGWRYLYYILLACMYFYSTKKLSRVSDDDDLFVNIVRKSILRKHSTLSAEDYDQQQ